MTWTLDSSHSSIDFSVRHMMITTVRGSFKTFSAVVDFQPDALHLSNVELTIQADSINTRDDKRDGHLKSPDFFDVATYPTIVFKSTGVEISDKSKGKLNGTLTIHGVTKPVVLEVEHVGTMKSPFGMTAAGFNGSTTINRKDFGLGWNVALEAGGWLVSDEIRISFEIELTQVPETAAAATA